MTAQNCVHLHARVVVPKPEFSVVDQRKIALVNELRNFRTVTSMGMVILTTASPSCIHVRARTTLKIPIELQRDYWSGSLLQMAST